MGLPPLEWFKLYPPRATAPAPAATGDGVVPPDHRRRGPGRSLLDRWLDAKRRGDTRTFREWAAARQRARRALLGATSGGISVGGHIGPPPDLAPAGGQRDEANVEGRPAAPSDLP